MSGWDARPDDESGGTVRIADFDDLDGPDGPDGPAGSGGAAPDVRVASFDGALDDLDDHDEPAVADVAEAADSAGGPGDAGEPPRVRVASFDGVLDDAHGGAADRRAPGRRTARSRPARDGSAGSSAARDDSAGRRSAGARSARSGKAGGGAGRGADAPVDDESRAKEICLRLLTDRARTVKELRDGLLRKEIPEDVADRVLERFDEVGLVDDEAFAGQWVRSRHRNRGLGRRAIAQELRRKGVAKEIADEALTEIDSEAELARARELVDKKIRSVSVGTREERASASRRLVGMLARKGYGAGVAYSVVREAIAARGAEEDELGEAPEDD